MESVRRNHMQDCFFFSQMLSTDVSASFLWELKNNISADPVLSCSFSVEYSHLTSNETASTSEICSAQFEISDYKV